MTTTQTTESLQVHDPVAPAREDRSGWPNATFAEEPRRSPALHDFLRNAIRAGQTASVFGGAGIGKTKSTISLFTTEMPGVRVEYLNGPNLAVEDLVIDAPVIDEDGEIRLEPALNERLASRPGPDGKPTSYVIVIDDPNQSEDQGVNNSLLQIQHDQTLQSFDLKKEGCVGVVVLNNDSILDTQQMTTDLAALDRVVHFHCTSAHTGWEWALAQKYHALDLGPVFEKWRGLPEEIRRNIEPRVLDHVIQALLLGYPGIDGLPLNGDGTRRRLVVTDGTQVHDRTAEIISAIAAAIGAPNPENVPGKLKKIVRDAIEHKLTVRVVSEPGAGKSGSVRDTAEEILGASQMPYYFSLPTTDPERFSLPLPVDGRIKQILTRALREDSPKCLIIDEANRGSLGIQAMLMEINEERTRGGEEIPGLTGIINLENPSVVMGHKMTVTKRNRAQTERFTLNVILADGDIDAEAWLLNVFPAKWYDRCVETAALFGEEPDDRDAVIEHAGVVIENILAWYHEDLEDDGRMWVSPRGIERIARTHLAGGDIDSALIHLEPGRPVPVNTALLKARLSSVKLTSFGELIANFEEWVETMKRSHREAGELGTADVDLVARILEQTSATVLARHPEKVAVFMFYLPIPKRMLLLGQGGDKYEVFKAAMLAGKEYADGLRAQGTDPYAEA